MIRLGKRLWAWFWRSWLRIPVLAAVGAVLIIGLAIAVVIHVEGGRDGVTRADVIVVLGAGVHRDAQPTGAFARRIAHAADLYRAGYAPAVLCSGGFAADRPISEAAACATLLRAHGVPDDAIYLEVESKSTEQNAMYALDLMQEHGWRAALVVTDRYHILRARHMFQTHGVPVVGYSPAGPIPLPEYLWGLRREVMALYWQGFKTLFNLPYTYVPYL